MDLIINQMVELEVMHEAYRYFAIEILTCSTIAETNLTITADRNALPLLTIFLVLNQIVHNLRIKDIFIFIYERHNVCRILNAILCSLCLFCRKLFLIKRCIGIIICQLECIHDVVLIRAIKDRSCYVKSQYLCSQTQMNLQDLTDVHT